MTSPARHSRPLAVFLTAAASTAALGAAAVFNYRGFQRRLATGAAALNDTLPVNSLWWRSRARLKGELLYVAIGDSAAQGIGATSPDRGYVGLLADQLRLRTGRTVRVVNLSVSGATAALAVRDQLPRFRSLSPDLVTVAIGANDIAQWDAAAFDAEIATLFAALPGHALVADLPCFHLPHNERKVAEANALLRARAAQHGLTVVALHATTKRSGLRSIATHVATDLFHPNDRGYRVWADAFQPSLTGALAPWFSPSAPQPASTVGGRG
ncbi:MAG: SGNH/GDSL hydrolase family protein [Cryobacterium sp.]